MGIRDFTRVRDFTNGYSGFDRESFHWVRLLNRGVATSASQGRASPGSRYPTFGRRSRSQLSSRCASGDHARATRRFATSTKLWESRDSAPASAAGYGVGQCWAIVVATAATSQRLSLNEATSSFLEAAVMSSLRSPSSVRIRLQLEMVV